MKKEILKHKAGAIKRWKKRKQRYDFVRRNLKKIQSLSTKGWPRMTMNSDYLDWLDIVYKAKDKGLYSLKTSNCDVIANLRGKAEDITGKKLDK